MAKNKKMDAKAAQKLQESGNKKLHALFQKKVSAALQLAHEIIRERAKEKAIAVRLLFFPLLGNFANRG